MLPNVSFSSDLVPRCYSAKMDTRTDTTAERLQRRRSRPRVQETESGYGYTSSEGNETGVPEATRSGKHVVVEFQVIYTCSRSKPGIVPRRIHALYALLPSQPSSVRTQAGRQARQYTPSNVGEPTAAAKLIHTNTKNSQRY